MTEKPIDHRQKTERRKDGTAAVLEALASGKITPGEGERITAIAAQYGKILEFSELGLIKMVMQFSSFDACQITQPVLCIPHDKEENIPQGDRHPA